MDLHNTLIVCRQTFIRGTQEKYNFYSISMGSGHTGALKLGLFRQS
jgi:hypothetical protein